jgi:hypothetical protein
VQWESSAMGVCRQRREKRISEFKRKKKNSLEAWLKQRRHVAPFVVSTDGLLGEEAKTLRKKLSTILTEMGKSYSEVRDYLC